MIQGHGGNIFAVARELGCAPEEIADMSSNINPLGPPPGLVPYLAERLPRIQNLPEVDGAASCRALAHLLDIDPAWILAGAGTTQFIYSACRALETRRALVIGPTYADYADACRQQGAEVEMWISRPENGFHLDVAGLAARLTSCDTVFLCTPNNPTGLCTPLAGLAELARTFPKTRFILDLSYLPFAEPELAALPAGTGQGKNILSQLKNLFLLWSGSKIFAMPGLRAGFLIAHPDALAPFRRLAQPWSLGVLAQEAMCWLGENRDTAQRFLAQTHALLQQEKQLFMERLAGTGLHIFPSATSFMLMQLGKCLQVAELCASLQAARILVRDCSNFPGLEPLENGACGFIRVALKDSATNARLATFLRKIALEHPS